MAKEIQKRWDAWGSAIMGFGEFLRDKVESLLPGRTDLPNFSLLQSQFENDDVAAKIIEKPVKEIFRVGYSVETDDSDLDKLVRDYVNGTGLNKVLRQAMTQARLLGGAAVYMICDDGGLQSEPLDIDGIRRLIGFQLLTPNQISAETYYAEETSGLYGKVASYRFKYGGAEIHASRLIVFDGIPVTDERRKELNGWALPVLVRVNEAVRSYHLSYKSSTALMSDVSQAVFKIKGLMEMIAGGNETMVLERMRINDYTRSTMRAIVMDADAENFERIASQLQGVPEMLEKFETRVASAADMPVTIVFGVSPAGLNATGESDTRHFYDMLAAEREDSLGPALEELYKVIFRAPNGPTSGVEPEGWEIEFAPFYEPTDKEVADTRKVYADIDVAYVNAGVLAPAEVALSRFGSGEWSYGMKIDAELRSENAADIEIPPASQSKASPQSLPAQAAEEGASA